MKINKNMTGEAAQQMAAALAENDQAKVKEAWESTMGAIAESVRADFEAVQASSDASILAQRGIRQLTSEEDRFYEALTAACRSEMPKQAFIDLIGSGKDEDLMPKTILEDVFRELEDEHELLQVINFTYTGYMTKWLRNSHTAQKAVWGKIDDAIVKEVTSDLEVVSIDQNKLTAFCVIPLDILDMGYAFMDAYVRRVLKEAMACGLEEGIISGTGIKCPFGIDRDIDPENINQSTGASQKDPVELTDFKPETYCDVVSSILKTEKGKARNVPEVCLIVNTFDYTKLVVPALPRLNPSVCGDASNLAVPTRIVRSTEVGEGTAVLFAPNAYDFCVGGSRNEIIEFDDSFRFLDDARTFKVVTHGDGKANDNTVSVVLDISGLKPWVSEVSVANMPEQVSVPATTPTA